MHTVWINDCSKNAGWAIGRVLELKVQLHLEIDEKQNIGPSMGKNTSTHPNNWIGAGCNRMFAQQGFEFQTGDGFKGVHVSLICRLLNYVSCAVERPMFEEESHGIRALDMRTN